MNARRLVVGYAAVRLAVGVALVVAPGGAGTPWLGTAAGDPTVRSLLRLLGVRDAALGAATVVATRKHGPAATWALAGAAADGADLLVTVANRGRLAPTAGAVLGAAAAGTATGLYAARRSARSPAGRHDPDPDPA
jgi:hypothetical protein